MVAIESPTARARLTNAALGTALVFAVSGALIGTWVSRLPTTRDRLHATATELGLALLAPGLGSLLSMPLVGRICGRYGSRATVVLRTIAPSSTLSSARLWITPWHGPPPKANATRS
jgi:MFS family permease